MVNAFVVSLTMNEPIVCSTIQTAQTLLYIALVKYTVTFVTIYSRLGRSFIFTPIRL